MGHQLRPHHDDQHDEHGHDHDDQHEQDHDHGSGWARVVHSVTQLFGGHCHDSADQVDAALESDAAGRRALVISLAGLRPPRLSKRSWWSCRGRSRCSATRCTTSPTP